MKKKTPLPFLESSNAETIKLIHTDILGDDSPKFKHLNIKTVLNMEPNGSSEYIAWTEKVGFLISSFEAAFRPLKNIFPFRKE